MFDRRLQVLKVEAVPGTGPTSSDHVLVTLRLGQRRSCPRGVAPTPRWCTRNPRFGGMLREVIDRLLPHGLGAFGELRVTVSLTHLAARQLGAVFCQQGACTDEEGIQWILVGMRAWRDGDACSAQRAVRAIPGMPSVVGGLGRHQSPALLASVEMGRNRVGREF